MTNDALMLAAALKAVKPTMPKLTGATKNRVLMIKRWREARPLLDQWRKDVRAVCEHLATTTPEFTRDTFLEAAGWLDTAEEVKLDDKP